MGLPLKSYDVISSYNQESHDVPLRLKSASVCHVGAPKMNPLYCSTADKIFMKTLIKKMEISFLIVKNINNNRIITLYYLPFSKSSISAKNSILSDKP